MSLVLALASRYTAENYATAAERAAVQLTALFRAHCRDAGLSPAASKAVQIQVNDGDFAFHVPDQHRAEYDRLEFGTDEQAPLAFERQFSKRHAATAVSLIERHMDDIVHAGVI